MKILLLGSLISLEAMESLNNKSKVKASVAPINYESMLARGLKENGCEIEALSVPPVAAYPHSCFRLIRKRIEKLDSNIFVQWIPFINIPILKQISINHFAKKELKKWLKENRNVHDKMIMMYSIYPPCAAPAFHLCKKYKCMIDTVIADLPEYMYTWTGGNGLKKIYFHYIEKKIKRLQVLSDNYILFTERMANRMHIEAKPYMVSEGLSNVHIYDDILELPKFKTRTFIYAGNLSRLYGIKSLVDAFMMLKGNYHLLLYGSGEDTEYIKQCALKDHRIQFYGRKERSEILSAIKQSHLVVVNKPTSDDYSNYSFSSKLLECMVSGTPVLTTKVGGMPKEYYRYFYFIEKEDVTGISFALKKYIELPENILQEKGNMAKSFAIDFKDYKKVTGDIYQFLNDQLKKYQIQK